MKIPIIPPLLYKNCFITDFKEKAKLFFLNNAPLFVIIAFFLLMSTITDKRLSTVTFSVEGFEKSHSKS